MYVPLSFTFDSRPYRIQFTVCNWNYNKYPGIKLIKLLDFLSCALAQISFNAPLVFHQFYCTSFVLNATTGLLILYHVLYVCIV